MPVTFGNIAFQALSLAVVGGWCWMVYAFRAQAAECLASTVSFSSGEGAGVENKRMYDRFLAAAITLGALSAGLGAVKVAAAMLAGGTGTPGTVEWRLAGLTGTAGVAGLPVWVAVVAVFAVALAVAAVVLVEVGMIRAAGGITLSGKFAGAIVQTKKNWMAAASLTVVPLVAAWTGVNPVRDEAIAYVIAGVAITLAVMFVIQTLRGFIKQKVSLLVWFLYLCTVEIFPVCAVVVAAMQNI